MYSSFDVSKKILELASYDGQQLSPMKLIKLVYIMHGWHLGIKGTPLINDSIQAWQYGPVIPELYHVIKRFGTESVDPNLIDLYSKKTLSAETSGFVESLWPSYKDMSAIELSALTHIDGSPWSETYNGEYYKPISNETIQSYYSRLIEKANEAQLATN